MDVIQTLNALAEKANEKHEDLNCGGCCVYASLVGHKLEELGIPVRGIAASMGHSGSVEKARPNVRKVEDAGEWNDNGVYFGHVGIEFDYEGKTYQYETKEGVQKKRRYLADTDWTIHPGHFTMEELDALASRASNWNCSFDREEIPRLKRLVNKAFK